jgi:hypothetical protein
VKLSTIILSFVHKLIANNGFASKLLGLNNTTNRAQVLITKPIKNLHIKGAVEKAIRYL